MGLFDVFKKKNCSICDSEIGLLGNRKLEDGNCCKDCARKLSPWFDDRRHSTVAQIKEQLAYREQNKLAVAAFQTSRTIGHDDVIYFDEAAGKFMVAKTNDIDKENPDVLDFGQVTGCELDISSRREELKREVTDKDGEVKRVSYNPPRYLYFYDFYMELKVNHPYFDDMRFRLNSRTLQLEGGATVGTLFSFGGRTGMDPTRDFEYREYEAMGREIKEILSSAPAARYTAPAPAPVQKPKAFCPWCGTESSGGKFCENCGGNLDG